MLPQCWGEPSIALLVLRRLQAVKEVCDKMRWAQPQYREAPRGQLWLATGTLPEAGLVAEGPPHADRRQAKNLAGEVSGAGAGAVCVHWWGLQWGFLVCGYGCGASGCVTRVREPHNNNTGSSSSTQQWHLTSSSWTGRGGSTRRFRAHSTVSHPTHPAFKQTYCTCTHSTITVHPSWLFPATQELLKLLKQHSAAGAHV